ncbi:glutamate synthase [Anopheles sinensis]|uniref:Glutamate synthase n=1 Tax=Anopheles sinensis TaxID=74873 RepID=A0A084WT61_ANOSI|nr:glutamate synthase [Anopheles sinensis]
MLVQEWHARARVYVAIECGRPHNETEARGHHAIRQQPSFHAPIVTCLFTVHWLSPNRSPASGARFPGHPTRREHPVRFNDFERGRLWSENTTQRLVEK